MRSIFKWPGGKLRAVPYIHEILPKGARLVEPFVGGGALSMNTDFQHYLFNDTNAHLIKFYQELKDGKDLFIKKCKKFFTQKNNSAAVYYKFRNDFNEGKNESALFLYLNRHGFNGLCRYNSDGKFNVPFGDYEKPYFPETEMNHFLSISKKISLYCLDFRRIFENLKQGDVVYCDPPFLPLSKTSNFTSFTSEGFTVGDQEDLARRAESAKVPVIISNHDIPLAREIYGKATGIRIIPSTRSIAADGSSRKRVDELLVQYNS